MLGKEDKTLSPKCAVNEELKGAQRSERNKEPAALSLSLSLSLFLSLSLSLSPSLSPPPAFLLSSHFPSLRTTTNLSLPSHIVSSRAEPR